jgi:hypothetical protein
MRKITGGLFDGNCNAKEKASLNHASAFESRETRPPKTYQDQSFCIGSTCPPFGVDEGDGQGEVPPVWWRFRYLRSPPDPLPDGGMPARLPRRKFLRRNHTNDFSKASCGRTSTV